ncbi:2-oxoglutarate-dependent dioxygenase DAO-like [Mercurialis annua]|uniref:2-oxoglutarate-dependent dioxygenase DAO-like n=1 Tax=Mercurialis annua TaxID=3986 RepID=UPI0024ADBE24|nr:2-oxoglutarate-dependent dioxygenase DAO-like [Mercurialis annua]
MPTPTENKKKKKKKKMLKKKSIPSIDVSDFPGEFERLRNASEEWGCFRIYNHNIPSTLLLEMKDVVRSLLDLPMEVKSRNAAVVASSGYERSSHTKPMYEALGIFDIASSHAVNSFCSQLDISTYQSECGRFPNEIRLSYYYITAHIIINWLSHSIN